MGPFLFLFSLMVLGAASAMLALLFWPIKRSLRKDGQMGPHAAKWTTRAFLLVPVIGACAFTLYGLYPPSSFYREEYRSVMGEDLHPDARFIRKSASYPDFRGEYASAALIELPPAEYERLHALVHDTTRFKLSEARDCEEYQEARGALTLDGLKEVYRGESRFEGTISFVSGRPEVIVMVCNF